MKHLLLIPALLFAACAYAVPPQAAQSAEQPARNVSQKTTDAKRLYDVLVTFAELQQQIWASTPPTSSPQDSESALRAILEQSIDNTQKSINTLTVLALKDKKVRVQRDNLLKEKEMETLKKVEEEWLQVAGGAWFLTIPVLPANEATRKEAQAQLAEYKKRPEKLDAVKEKYSEQLQKIAAFGMMLEKQVNAEK